MGRCKGALFLLHGPTQASIPEQSRVAAADPVRVVRAKFTLLSRAPGNQPAQTWILLNLQCFL